MQIRVNVKSALIWLVLWLMVLLARCAPPAHGAPLVPPKPTLIEPVTWPPTVYLPIVMR